PFPRLGPGQRGVLRALAARRPSHVRSAGLCHGPAGSARARPYRPPGQRYLRRARPVLQLSPRDAAGRQGLRPRPVGDLPGRISIMALHFTREELAERRAATIRLMQQRGLDGMLIFRQESMYYLT